MSFDLLSLIPFFIVVAIMLVNATISTVICILVYKDAQKRDMNPVLWSLIATLVPSLIGLIIYLVVRSDKKKILICSCCKNPIKEEYSVCPNCGNRLKTVCKNCSMPLRPEWRVCPNCSAPVIEEPNAVPLSQANKPPKKENGALAAIIICAIIIPSLLVSAVFGVLFWSVGDITQASGSEAAWLTKEDLEEKYPSLSLWVKSCDQISKDEVFIYSDEVDGRMLIYVKNHGNALDIYATEYDFWSNATLQMTLPQTSKNTEETYTLLFVDTMVSAEDVTFICNSEYITPVIEYCEKMPDVLSDLPDGIDSFFPQVLANDSI